MRSKWTSSLALLLGFLVTSARGQEGVWRAPATPRANEVARPAASLGKPIASAGPTAPPGPAASLGRPVVVASTPSSDSPVQPASYSDPVAPLESVVRGQSADAPPSRPMPVGSGDGSAPPLSGWRRADDVVASTPGAPLAGAPGLSPPVVGLPGPLGPPSLFATSGPSCPGCAAAQCPNCVPPCNDCCFNNCFWIGAEYLLWWTKGDRTPPLVTTGSATDPIPGALGQPGTRILYGNGQMGTGPFSGVRLNAGYWFTDNHLIGLDFSGFILGQQNNNFNASSLGLGGYPILARPIISQTPGASFNTEQVQGVAFPGVAAGSVEVQRTSILWGAQANLRSNFFCGPNGYLDGLVGYRMLGLDESLNINESIAQSDGTTFQVNDRFSTTNRFYGAQVGLDGQYRFGNWWLGARMMLGMGTTQETVDISGTTVTTSPAFGRQVAGVGVLAGATNIGHYNHDMFTVVPEVGVSLGYQISQHVRCFASYNFLYWSSVARPGEQIDRGVNATFLPGSPVAPTGPARPAFTFQSTDYWAQGITFGLEFCY